jgi:hypothetical protein
VFARETREQGASHKSILYPYDHHDRVWCCCTQPAENTTHGLTRREDTDGAYCIYRRADRVKDWAEGPIKDWDQEGSCHRQRLEPSMRASIDGIVSAADGSNGSAKRNWIPCEASAANDGLNGTENKSIGREEGRKRRRVDAMVLVSAGSNATGVSKNCAKCQMRQSSRDEKPRAQALQ